MWRSRRHAPNLRQLRHAAVLFRQPDVPFLPHRRCVPPHLGLVQQIVREDHVAPAIPRRERPPELFERAQDALIGVTVSLGPRRQSLPVIRPGGMHVKTRLLGQRQKLVKLGQAVRRQLARLRIKRTEREKHADAIAPEFAQPREISARCLGVKLLPHLRRPAGAGPEIGDPQRHEGLAAVGDESMSGRRHAHLRQRPEGRLGAQHRGGHQTRREKTSRPAKAGAQQMKSGWHGRILPGRARFVTADCRGIGSAAAQGWSGKGRRRQASRSRTWKYPRSWPSPKLIHEGAGAVATRASSRTHSETKANSARKSAGRSREYDSNTWAVVQPSANRPSRNRPRAACL